MGPEETSDNVLISCFCRQRFSKIGGSPPMHHRIGRGDIQVCFTIESPLGYALFAIDDLRRRFTD